MSENAEDPNTNDELGTSDDNESQLQINVVETSQKSTHRDSELLICIYIYIYIYIYVCVCMCVCVCVRVYVYVCAYVCV